jgi:hypothetical protein
MNVRIRVWSGIEGYIDDDIPFRVARFAQRPAGLQHGTTLGLR